VALEQGKPDPLAGTELGLLAQPCFGFVEDRGLLDRARGVADMLDDADALDERLGVEGRAHATGATGRNWHVVAFV
jgi:hypothetical protein